jgi:hypothetical protein
MGACLEGIEPDDRAANRDQRRAQMRANATDGIWNQGSDLQVN